MFVVPQDAAEAFGAARPATSAVRTRERPVKTAVTACRDGRARLPSAGGHRSWIRILICPPKASRPTMFAHASCPPLPQPAHRTRLEHHHGLEHRHRYLVRVR